MIRLYAEKLNIQLQKILYPCYFLFGNDYFLLQEGVDCIRNKARAKQFNEHFNITVNDTTDWNIIFNLCQTRSLFSGRQTLLLVLPEVSISALIAERLLQLTSILHDDILLILLSRKLTRVTKNSAWFQALDKNMVLVSCATPKQAYLSHWVAKRALSMNLNLDDAACQLLCYYYEGNLLALSQALERFSLLYSDNNLTLARVQAGLFSATRFMPFQWIDAILAGKSRRSSHILHQLQMEGTEPIILLRSIQDAILLLLKLKRENINTSSHVLFKHYKAWQQQNRQHLLMQALKRFGLRQLHDAVILMMKIELALKRDYNSYLVWFDLNTLGLLMCGKLVPTGIFNI